jgi:predicted hotdog family 3-hydroxylacyl-ACP dehydratase
MSESNRPDSAGRSMQPEIPVMAGASGSLPAAAMNSPVSGEPLTKIIPPIEKLLPHRGTMLLLDRAIEFDGETAVAEYTPRQSEWYSDGAGNMPAWIGIELMAQTVAVHVALTKIQLGLTPRMGALLGARSYRSAVTCFVAGRPLRIRVQLVFADADSGLGAYGATIEQDGETLANSALKVYEPENFELYLQGNR